MIKGLCKPLMLDVVVPEAHQNDCSYLRELIPSIHYARI